MSLETVPMSEDALRDMRVQEENRARVTRLESAEQAQVMEARIRAEAEKSAMRAKDIDRRRFESIKSDEPRIIEASRRAHEFAKPIDSSVREYLAPPAESGIIDKPMIKEVDDSDDWIEEARESVKPPESPKKKGFFSSLFK